MSTNLLVDTDSARDIARIIGSAKASGTIFVLENKVQIVQDPSTYFIS